MLLDMGVYRSVRGDDNEAGSTFGWAGVSHVRPVRPTDGKEPAVSWDLSESHVAGTS